MKLSEARSIRKMTQYELAKRVGVSQALISQIERGYHKPSERQKRAILKALSSHPKAITWEEDDD